MDRPHCSDKEPEGLMKRPHVTRRNSHGDRESGQAMVEFALILFPLLTVVAGIIYFGIGLNYWLDMQRIANQGARWAAVNNWPPECPRGVDIPPGCTGAISLSETLKRQAIADGLEDSVRVYVCFPGETSGGPDVRDQGDPVRVRLETDFTFFFIDRVSVELVGEATMRLEQEPELITTPGYADPNIAKPCPT